MNDTAKQITPTDATQVDAMTLVSQAVSNGANMESIDKLIELVKFNDQREALRAFNQAFTAAQAEFPAIKKTARVDYTPKQGGRVQYDFAKFSHEINQLRPVLQKHGFSFRHEVLENDDKSVTVRCILAHEAGHSESAALTGPADTTGSKNSIQAIGSTVSYLKRYTFEAVTGIVTTDQDDDGRGPERITEQQVADMESLIQEVSADRDAFLKFAKVDRLEDIHPNAYGPLVKKLRAKAKQEA